MSLSIAIPKRSDDTSNFPFHLDSQQAGSGKRTARSRTGSLISSSPGAHVDLKSSFGRVMTEIQDEALGSLERLYQEYTVYDCTDLKGRIQLLESLETRIGGVLETAIGVRNHVRLRDLQTCASDLIDYFSQLSLMDREGTLAEIRGDESGRQTSLDPRQVLEVLDPLHRPWGTAAYRPIVTEWEQSESGLDFFVWLECQDLEELRALTNCTSALELELPKLSHNVQYLTDSNERENYRLDTLVAATGEVLLAQQNRDGLLMPFDTSRMASIQRGDGSAIYVLGPEDELKIFAAAHKWGVFHHSSFFAGHPLSGAGDIVVKDGHLMRISNFSGHYLPDWKEPMLAVLRKLDQMDVSLKDAEVDVIAACPMHHHIEISDEIFDLEFKMQLQATFPALEFLKQEGVTPPVVVRDGKPQGEWLSAILQQLATLDTAGRLDVNSIVKIRRNTGVEPGMYGWFPGDYYEVYDATDFLKNRGRRCHCLFKEPIPMPVDLQAFLGISDFLPGAYKEAN